MERSTISQPPIAGPGRTQATDADTNERDPQIRSLRVPGLVSGPLLAARLRKLFRRTDTPASR